MVKRSVKASALGIVKVKGAIERKGWTQDYLANQAGLSTRNSVWKFLSGRSVDRNIFMEICFQLDLDWQDIADLPQDFQLATPSSELRTYSDLEQLVQTLRSLLQGPIQAQCGTIQSSFDVTQPLLLEQVYTSVNILPRLSNQQWLEVSDLEGPDSKVDRDRLNPIKQKTVPALEAINSHTKLVILGKPGSGKTTFLKHIAIMCDEGKFKEDCIPTFISLRTFATYRRIAEDFSLLNYISSTWNRYDISTEQVETLLQEGKLLVLLDGLDEIAPQDSEEILQQIQQFAEIYYQNQIVITCRIAAQTYHFYGFTYVELADFNQDQVKAFAQRWFVATTRTSEEEGIEKATQFLDQLNRKDNQSIQELASTPILLSLICSIFQERSKFPSKRAKLYQEGLEILLSRWDQSRGIKRGEIYGNLSLPDKFKLLGEIAATTFERGNYFFEKNEVLQIIADYLLTLPDVSSDLETLWLNSERVLRDIEVQHGLLVERAKGIYSFSHLTFQEYLISRKIVASPNTEVLHQSLQRLATHVTDPQWREVILLTVSMLPSADFLLQQLKTSIDVLFTEEPQLQQFLRFIEEKVSLMQIPYHPWAVRAFYFSLFYNQDFNLAISLDIKLASQLSGDLALDSALYRAFAISLTLLDHPDINQILNLSFSLDIERSFSLTSELARSLQNLKQQLPPLTGEKKDLQVWWEINGLGWVENFRNVMIEHRSLGYNWDFSQVQKDLLAHYYRANQFLVECLKSTQVIHSSILMGLIQLSG